MKSKKTIIVLSALTALCLSACNNDDEVSVNDGAVRFTAGIGKEAVATPASRATGTSWAAGDAIGIFMVANSTTTIAEEAANRQFTTATGDGNFTPIASEEIYYPMDGSPVDFVAYYPYHAAAAWDGTLPVSTAGTQTTASQASIDLLWASADNSGKGYKKSAATAPVDLRFHHCLSKLTMNCKFDSSMGAADPTGMAVTIKGMNTAARFTLQTGKTDTPTTPDNIVPRRLDGAPAEFVAAYDAIILPAAYTVDGTVKVDFVIGDETFTWDVKAVTFAPGKDHIYEVTITRTGVQATGTVADWEEEKMGPVTAE